MDVDIKKLNEQQKKAVSSKSDKILILAGAGSGKTSTLTHRIGHLVKNNKVKPANILAVTLFPCQRNERTTYKFIKIRS